MATGEYTRGAKLERFSRGLESPSKALEVIGILGVSLTQRAFDDQRLGNVQWRPRRVPNIFGIIRDFAEGKKKPPTRRWDPLPALRDTGRLYQSIAHRIVSDDTVQIGTNLDYASVHQFGGDSESETITPTMQQAIAEWLRKEDPQTNVELGWLTNPKFAGSRLKAKIPARPFVGWTDELFDIVVEAVGEQIFEVT